MKSQTVIDSMYWVATTWQQNKRQNSPYICNATGVVFSSYAVPGTKRGEARRGKAKFVRSR